MNSDNIYLKSKYLEKIIVQRNKIRRNPRFQKEYKHLLITNPYIIDEELNKCLSSKKGWSRYLAHKKKWQDFYDRWDIKGVLNGIPMLKSKVQLISDSKGIPAIRALSKDVTKQDIIDNLPFFMEIKNHHLGRASITQGRKKDKSIIRRNMLIKQAFCIRRKKGEKAADIIQALANFNILSVRTIQRIVYNT